MTELMNQCPYVNPMYWYLKDRQSTWHEEIVTEKSSASTSAIAYVIMDAANASILRVCAGLRASLVHGLHEHCRADLPGRHVGLLYRR